MADDELNVGILLNTTDAKRELDQIGEEVKSTNNSLEKTKENSRDTMLMAINVIRNSYGILRGALKAAGITIDSITNAVITATLQMGQQFYTLATAQSVTPGMQWAAVITAIQAGIIIASAVNQEKESKQISQEIEATNLILNGINSIIGGMNF